MPTQIHRDFEKFSIKGKEFIELWNKGNRDGIQVKLADHFGMSVPTVSRIRRKLELEPLHSGNHPGRQHLIKRVKKLYYHGRSTLQIAEILKLNAQSIQNILHKTTITMNPQHCINPLYFKVKNLDGITLHSFLKEIKNMYCEDNISAAKIAQQFGVDQGTVACKLKAMGVDLRQNHNQVLEGGYPCQWCGNIMEKVYQNKGPRKQKFCDNKCKNKAKDYRRMLKGGRGSPQRLKDMEDFLMKSWGSNYEKAVKDLLNVKAVIKNER